MGSGLSGVRHAGDGTAVVLEHVGGKAEPFGVFADVAEKRSGQVALASFADQLRPGVAADDWRKGLFFPVFRQVVREFFLLVFHFLVEFVNESVLVGEVLFGNVAHAFGSEEEIPEDFRLGNFFRMPLQYPTQDGHFLEPILAG